MKAVLLGSVVEANWYETGVPSKSLVEEWHLNIPSGEGEGGAGMAVASDGHFLYVHGPFGLAKVGSGYGNTQKVMCIQYTHAPVGCMYAITIHVCFHVHVLVSTLYTCLFLCV